jgi:hypothetical protein
MIVFWKPLRSKARHYRVIVRPTLKGEFLVFPFGYKRGGKGYVLSLTLKKELETAGWFLLDTVLLTLMLVALFASVIIGISGLGITAILLVCWQFTVLRRFEQRLARIIPRARPAPVRLTKDRYDLEYASQFSVRYLLGLIAGSGVLGIASVVATLVLLDAQEFGYALLTLLTFAGAAWAAWKGYTLWRLKKRAFAFSVAAGDPVDIGLPEQKPEVGEQKSEEVQQV